MSRFITSYFVKLVCEVEASTQLNFNKFNDVLPSGDKVPLKLVIFVLIRFNNTNKNYWRYEQIEVFFFAESIVRMLNFIYTEHIIYEFSIHLK